MQSQEGPTICWALLGAAGLSCAEPDGSETAPVSAEVAAVDTDSDGTSAPLNARPIDAPEDVPAPNHVGPSRAPDDWVGYQLGLEPPMSMLLGVIELDSEGPSLVGEGPSAADYAGPEFAFTDRGPDYVVWGEVNVISGEMFEFWMPRAHLEQLHQHMVSEGADRARGPEGLPLGEDGVPQDVLADELQATPDAAGSERDGRAWSDGVLGAAPRPQGTWSNGIDSRDRMTIADGSPVNHWPFRTISHMSAGKGCNGTLIGQKILLTAAHCVYSNGSYFNQVVRPRRDPSVASPHRSAGLVRYWVRDSYLNGSCGDSFGCNKYDIATAELDANLGDVVGGMGYAATITTDTESYVNYMRGYPSCHSDFSASRPSPCTSNALYGSEQTCVATEFHTGGCYGDGWFCEFRSGCDGSPGQSGSAVYTYDVQGFGGSPAALGVYSEFNCTPPNCDDVPNPNVFTRITPDVAQLISLAKTLWGSW